LTGIFFFINFTETISMKKILVVSALIAIGFFGYSQKVVTDKPIESKSVQSADLEITNVILIEAKKDEQSLLHKVKVSVTIKNNGVSPSGSTLIKMMVQNQSPNMVAPQYTQPGNPWYELGDARTVNSIAAGKSFTGEYQFTEIKKVTKGDSFTMRVIVDAGKVLAEANENDNFSAPMSVTPVIVPAELVAIAPTTQITSQLIKIDTLCYTIGQADFHLQPKAHTSADLSTFFQCFIEMNPHGITIKKFGGEPIVRNVTLIAPLHLPVGSKIKRVKFNYIKLAGTDLVPHLVLRSHHQRTVSNEGWGLNTPITSYWVTSPARDGAEGYRVMGSITNAGFNMSVTKGSTYYFEILGADARSTATPMGSEWPTNDKIFIWSINVYYTLE
jgi:CARDB